MPEKDEQTGAPRSFWSGTISFGLVSVPVSLFVATRSSRVSLRMVDRDGTPLRRVYFCSREEEPLTRDDLVRGYEVAKDRFVVVEDDELTAIAPEKSQEIDLQRFVDVNDIDPVYFERAYFLAPGRGGTRPYRLLARAMEDAGRAGIATFVMRGKEYLVAIIAEHGILRAETLRFHDELRSPGDVGLPELGKPARDHVRSIGNAMRKLYSDQLDLDLLTDRHAARLNNLVKAKLRGGRDVVQARDAEPSERESAEVIDLMQVLKRSVEHKEASARGKGRRRSTATGKEAKAPGSASRKGGQPDLEARTRTELYQQAQRLDIAGRSSMSKAELVDAIRAAS